MSHPIEILIDACIFTSKSIHKCLGFFSLILLVLLKTKDEELSKCLSDKKYLENKNNQLIKTNLKLTRDVMLLRVQITHQKNGMDRAE